MFDAHGTVLGAEPPSFEECRDDVTHDQRIFRGVVNIGIGIVIATANCLLRVPTPAIRNEFGIVSDRAMDKRGDGAEMRIISFIFDPVVVDSILCHLAKNGIEPGRGLPEMAA